MQVLYRKVLNQLNEVGSVDPQLALLLLHQCGRFCKLVHLSARFSRSAYRGPSIAADVIHMPMSLVVYQPYDVMFGWHTCIFLLGFRCDTLLYCLATPCGKTSI